MVTIIGTTDINVVQKSTTETSKIIIGTTHIGQPIKGVINNG